MITIIISTLNLGILKTINAVKLIHPQLTYLIVHQNNQAVQIPTFLLRSDINVISSKVLGLSKSRNLGLKHCNTKYALIADDDIEYFEDAIEKVLKIIEIDNPDFATFKIKTLQGESEYKKYSKSRFNFNDNRYHYVSSVEMLLNVEKLKMYNIQFDECFGLGSFLKKGEEDILISDMLSKNFYGNFYPLELVLHPYESSGKKKDSKLFNYFFMGAYHQRLNKKKHFYNNDNSILPLAILYFLCFYLGKYYIKFLYKK